MHSVKNIRFKGYKVFSSEEYTEVQNISPVNVIIGKNNSGKTSLLDIMESVFDSKTKLRIGFDIEDLQLDLPFDNNMVNGAFSGGLSGIGRWNKTSLTDYTTDKVFPFRVKVGDKVEILDEIPVISLKGLLEMKKSLNREKDYEDIKLIEQKLNN